MSSSADISNQLTEKMKKLAVLGYESGELKSEVISAESLLAYQLNRTKEIDSETVTLLNQLFESLDDESAIVLDTMRAYDHRLEIITKITNRLGMEHH